MMSVSCESDVSRDDALDCSGEAPMKTHSNHDWRRRTNELLYTIPS